jgi:hypothetical protein
LFLIAVFDQSLPVVTVCLVMKMTDCNLWAVVSGRSDLGGIGGEVIYRVVEVG